MTVLGLADDLRLGEAQVEKVYLGAEQVWSAEPPFDLSTAQFDLRGWALAGGTQFDDMGTTVQTVWPDQTINGNDATAGDGGGADNTRGFVLTTDVDGTHLAAAYSRDSAMWIQGVFVRTVFIAWTPGAEYDGGSADGAETCSPGFNEDITGGAYDDLYGYGGDPASSYIASYTLTSKSQYGGPQAGESMIRTMRDGVVDEVYPMHHVDGPVMDPQTVYNDNRVANLSEDFPGILFANYTGGGYCTAGEHHWILGFEPVLTDDECESVRDQMIAELAAHNVTITKRDQFIPPPSAISGTVTDTLAAPVAGASVYVDRAVGGAVLGGPYLTDVNGDYLTDAVAPFAADVVVRADPPSNTLCQTYAGDVVLPASATTYLADGAGGEITDVDIQLVASLDLSADGDTTDLWDATDPGSLTLTGDVVDSWANQIGGRGAFALSTGSPNVGVHTINGDVTIYCGNEERLLVDPLTVSGAQTIILVGELFAVAGNGAWLARDFDHGLDPIGFSFGISSRPIETVGPGGGSAHLRASGPIAIVYTLDEDTATHSACASSSGIDYATATGGWTDIPNELGALYLGSDESDCATQRIQIINRLLTAEEVVRAAAFFKP